MIYDITIIGSGPSSLLTLVYLKKNYPELNLCLISDDIKTFHCTYCVFMSQIENTWIYDLIDKNELFKKIIKLEINCYNKRLSIPDKYGMINNQNLFDLINNYMKDVDIINSKVNFIESVKDNKLIYFRYNNIQQSVKSKFIIEGIGFQKPLGLKYQFNNHFYKQVFVGYKIRVKHDFHQGILLDWQDYYDNFDLKSFCYILPLSKNELFMEETILLTDKLENIYYEILENRLRNRINEITSNYQIMFKEKNTIPINTSIPKFNSLSFGIGQVGNMINMMSGYTLGYTIYHIPEFCKLIVENNFNTKKVYQNYWNLKRRNIFRINYAGIEMMNSLSQKELADFQYHYFKEIVKKSDYQHKIIFLNCDNNINFWSFLGSCKYYFNLPIKYLKKILYYSLKNFIILS